MPSFPTLLRLQVELVAARARALPAWQKGLYAVCFATAVLFFGAAVPRALELTPFPDEQLLAITLFALGAAGVFAVGHLGGGGRETREVDPLDLLPVPRRWRCALEAVDAAARDPWSALVVPGLFAGYALASSRPAAALAGAGALCVAGLPALAAARLAVARSARRRLPPRLRALVQQTVFLALAVGLIALAADIGADEGAVRAPAAVSRLALALWSMYRAAGGALRLVPLAWPGLALTGAPGAAWWALAVLLAAAAALAWCARFAERAPEEPVETSRNVDLSARRSVVPGLVRRWLPAGPPALVELEVERAVAGSALFAAARVAAWSLVLLYLITRLSTSASDLQGRLLPRFPYQVLLLAYVVVADLVVREGPALALELALPLRAPEVLLARLPALTLLMVVGAVPALAAVALMTALPVRELAAAAARVAVGAVLAALTAVGAGGTAAGGQIWLVLLLSAFAFAPAGYALATDDAYRGAAAGLAAALVVAGLWQKALARLALGADPSPVRPPATLLGDTALAMALYVLACPVEGFAALTLSGHEALLTMVGVFQLAVLGTSLAYLRWRRTRAGAAGLDALPLRALVAGTPAGWVAGLGAGLATAAGGLALHAFATAAGAPGALAQVVQGGQESPLVLALAVPFMLVIAPLAEELFFRRLLFCGLREATGRVLPSALLSALLFAFLHPPGAFPLTLAVGVASALLFARFRSLAPCLALHLTHNSILLYLSLRGAG